MEIARITTTKKNNIMNFQATSIMVGYLKKAHEAQVKVAEMNDGYSIHIDHSSHEMWRDYGKYYMTFDVTLFDGTELVQSWEFHSGSEVEELDKTLEDLMWKINRI